MTESFCEIPLVGKGGIVVARTRVDEDDWLRYARYRWYRNAGGYAVGRRATKGYKRTGYRGPKVGGAEKLVYLHRLIGGGGRKVDHINRDRLDNRRSNLRIVDDVGNGQNVSKRPGLSSIYRGVSWNKRRNKWVARAQASGRHIHLGYFEDEHEAGRVAAEWRALNMPYSGEAISV